MTAEVECLYSDHEPLELSDPDFTPRDQRDRKTFTANEGGRWTEPSAS